MILTVLSKEEQTAAGDQKMLINVTHRKSHSFDNYEIKIISNWHIVMILVTLQLDLSYLFQRDEMYTPTKKHS